LINEYKPGEGIMPHEDGAAYSPLVATISLAAPIVLDLYEKIEDSNDENGAENATAATNIQRDDDGRPVPQFRILQEPGSLLITRGKAYEVLLHGISPIRRDENLDPDTVVNWSLLGDKTKFENGVNERETRISLTYRDVLKVSKVGFGILGRR
jgi:alkylated DNA repair protein alkB homolog 6